MRRRIALPVLVAVALAVAGCGGSGAGGTTAPTSPTTSTDAAATAGAEPASTSQPRALVVSVSEITVIDGDNRMLDTASFSAGDDVLALLSAATGSTPDGRQSDQDATTTYDWGAFSLVLSDEGAARIDIAATAVGDLQLRADAGIAVGTGVAAAVAQGAVTDPADPARLRYQVTEAPGTTSQSTPDTAGVDFVALVTDGGSVTRILAPADDYSDF